MESWRNRVSGPPSWVLTIRLVEAAVVVCVASAVLEMWVSAQSAESFAPSPGDGTVSPEVSLADRFLAMSLISYRGPTAMVVAALLVLGVLVAARRVTSHARVVVLLWEQLALAALILLVSLVQLLGLVVAAGSDSGFYVGRERTWQLLIAGGAPLTAALVCGVFGLWWWPVRQEADQRAALELAGDPPRPTPVARPEPAPVARPEPAPLRQPAREPAGGDFAQAEVIDAAAPPERPARSGYEDYFRRR